MKYVTKRLEWVDDILRDASKKVKELCRILNHAENHGCKDIRNRSSQPKPYLPRSCGGTKNIRRRRRMKHELDEDQLESIRQDAAKEEWDNWLKEQDWKDEKLWKK